MMKSGSLGLLGFAVFTALVLAGVNLAAASQCVDCHADVLKQLKGNSHHVQGVGISGKHCYACHWEATATGAINPTYHQGQTGKKSSRGKKGKVDLVVWIKTERPTVHKPDTAVTFSASAMGTATERKEVAGVTRHCLGCHSDSNNNTRPFSGDNNKPLKYAWDGQSIASRYAQKAVTTWGKYSTASTNKKQQVTKAFSAHGNAAANQGGWSALSGYDGGMPITRGGIQARNVECFDCHNSHGSTVSGITSSYRTFDNSYNGAIIKQTSSGKSGYQMSYTPSVNSYVQSKNPFNAGAGICFDCHETARAGATPWGYNSTFGASQVVMGYKDTLGFGPGSKGSTARFANRQSREDIASSHLKAGKSLDHAGQNLIKGLCTPCHDPHGISPTLGKKMTYAVPLLKGAWLTSPYREDGPPSGLSGKDDRSTGSDDFNAVNREAGSNFGKEASSIPYAADFNAVNREVGGNFGKVASGVAIEADFNAVNRTAGANFGKGVSEAALSADYNAVNREAGANFGKGVSEAARAGDYNAVNRYAGANFGKEESSIPRAADFNTVNRAAGTNFGKGTSEAAQAGDYNIVNREAGVNFGKGTSGAPGEVDFNAVNRQAGANFGQGTGVAARKVDFNMPSTMNRDSGSNFAKSGSGAPREPVPGMKYNVDRNTFGGDNRIKENDEIFGGICLNCHSREKLTGESRAGLVHKAVKGWGNNKEHSFPCSKCHQSHNSGLPRLMQTNCFVQGPSGLRENSGLPWLPFKETVAKDQNRAGLKPILKSAASSKNKIVGCHVRQFSRTNVTSNNPDGMKEVMSW